MKRSLLILLFIGVLAMPFLLRSRMRARGNVMKNTSGAARLVVLTPHTESIRREFADAFSAWHEAKFAQPVEIDYRTLSTNDIVKYLAAGKETLYDKLGTYRVDIVWGGGDHLFDVELKHLDVLAPLELEASVLQAAYPQPELAGLPLYDRAASPAWFGTALSSFGIVYNKDVLKHLNLPEPRTWADLKDRKYRNWIVLTDPTKSGVARSVFMVIVERAMADAAERGQSENEGWMRGMGLIRQIAANARVFNDSGTAVAGWVSTGDVAAGMAIDFQARFQIEAVGESRLGYVEPAAATALNPDPVAMVKGAPNHAIARRFIDYLLSEQGQRLLITRAGAPGGPKQTSLRRLPIVRSVYENPRDFTDSVNPFSAASGFNTSPSRRRTFGILGHLIEASCMNLLQELRETRKAILLSHEAYVLDGPRYMGGFPMDQHNALELQQKWSNLDALARLREQRELTELFRAEYAELKLAAQRKQFVPRTQPATAATKPRNNVRR